MKNSIFKITIITLAILLIPLIAMQFTNEVQWDLFDFVVMGVLIFGTGLAYKYLTRKKNSTMYKAALGIGLVAGLLLIWINGAVGLIGNENNPANLLYGGVLLIGVIGAGLSRLKPQGMAWTLYITACAQFLVPIIALIFWSPESTSWGAAGVAGVFMLNTFFVLLFTVSGLLFQRSSMASAQ